MVKRIISGGPADRTRQVQTEDILTAVNGLVVAGMDASDVAILLLGPKSAKDQNKTVLTLMRPSGQYDKPATLIGTCTYINTSPPMMGRAMLRLV